MLFKTAKSAISLRYHTLSKRQGTQTISSAFCFLPFCLSIFLNDLVCYHFRKASPCLTHVTPAVSAFSLSIHFNLWLHADHQIRVLFRPGPYIPPHPNNGPVYTLAQEVIGFSDREKEKKKT